MNEQKTREEIDAWIARFAPLVMQEAQDEGEVRRRIATAQELRAGIPDSSPLGQAEDAGRVSTLQRAVGQLDSLEDDLRRRLARLDPGDPMGRPDLEALNERLQERLARQEVGLQEAEVPALVRKTGTGNPAGAAFMFLFGLGWTAFTVFHCVLMVGGLYAAFGPPALALLLFYAIFFFVGFSMLGGAIRMASAEWIDVTGRTLTVEYRFGPFRKRRVYELPPGSRAEIADMEVSGFGPMRSRYPRTVMEPQIVFTDLDGKTVGVAKGATPTGQTRLRDEINNYLALNAG